MTSKPRRARATKELSPHARIVTEVGPQTAKAVGALNDRLTKEPLLAGTDEVFPMLAELLRDWPDEQAAGVISAISEKLVQGGPVPVESLSRWIRIHRGDPASVRECLLLDPPAEIDVLRLWSRAGSQKVVFLAKWQLTQREVVLKKVIPGATANGVFGRELQPHPLSMSHPNIIETHLLKNERGQPFLVERRLPMVLNDDEPSRGIHEAANLLRDIASALEFLHEKRLIHGDIKPDNIGEENGLYILLDFGICRKEEDFAGDVTPTGSLRTRAPELLAAEPANHTKASDVWGLGATVYNYITGRFPLLERGESPPRISQPKERDEFLSMIMSRSADEWDEWVDCAAVPEPLRKILESVLSKDASVRPTARELVRAADEQLSALLRHRDKMIMFSPSEEIDQLLKYLPKDPETLQLMPDNQRRILEERLNSLGQESGLTQEQKTKLAAIRERVPRA